MSTTPGGAHASTRRVRIHLGLVLTAVAAPVIAGCDAIHGNTAAESQASRRPPSSAQASPSEASGKHLNPDDVTLAQSALSESKAIWANVESSKDYHTNGEVLNPGTYTLQAACVGSGSVTVRLNAGSQAPSTVLTCAPAPNRAVLSVVIKGGETLVTAVAVGKQTNEGVLAWQLIR